MRSILCLVGVIASGCLSPLEPDVGEPLRERCVDQDSDPDTDVEFGEYILRDIIFADRGCNCHLPSEPTHIGIELAGLDLSSYEKLRKGGANTGASIVVPGSPCTSLLVQKLQEGPPFGSRMPANGPPFLTDEQLQLVRDWIAEGARDD